MATSAQAFRSLLRAPWFTAAAVATFALGIGVNIAVFSVIDRMLFRPLPYAHRERLVQIHGMTARSSAAPQAFLPRLITREIAAGSVSSIESIAFASVSESPNEPLQLAYASYNLLSTVGVRPILGRDFAEGDATAKERALLLTHEAWQRRYGGDPELIGTVLREGGWTGRVVGVLPRGFLLPSTRFAPRLDALTADFEDFRPRESDGNGLMTAAPVARLAPGFSIEQAQAEVDVLVARLRPDNPVLQRAAPADGRVVTVQPLQQGLVFIFAPYLWLIAAAVWIVLLVACVNLSTLLLARGRSREREAAVRTALGATFTQLLKASLAETVVLGAASAAVALAVCRAAQGAVMAIVPEYFHGFAVSALDLRLVGLSFGAAFAAAILAGIVPALTLRRLDVLPILQQAGRSGSARLRGGGALLAIEAALGIVLVAGASMTVRSFLGLVLANPGFGAANLYHLHVQHGYERGGPVPYPAERVRAVEEIVRAHPGVVRVGAATQLPVGRFAGLESEFLERRGITGHQYGAGAGLFAALGTSILAGREFVEDDLRTDAPVAIVNQRAAAALWPGVEWRDVVGRTIEEAGMTRTIIGVVADITRVPGGRADPAIAVPVNTREARRSSSALMIAARLAPGLAPDVRALDAALDARFGNRNVRADAVVDTMTPFLQRPRFQAALFGALAAIALLLSVVGIYAVASFEMSRRRFEMGVRLALGASARHVQSLAIRAALRPVVLGAIAGMLIAFWAGKFLQAFLVDVDARDPWTLALVAAVVIAAAIVAAWLPALRASRVDPVATLRAQ